MLMHFPMNSIKINDRETCWLYCIVDFFLAYFRNSIIGLKFWGFTAQYIPYITHELDLICVQ